jgi:hypothetical protein
MVHTLGWFLNGQNPLRDPEELYNQIATARITALDRPIFHSE